MSLSCKLKGEGVTDLHSGGGLGPPFGGSIVALVAAGYLRFGGLRSRILELDLLGDLKRRGLHHRNSEFQLLYSLLGRFQSLSKISFGE